MLAGISHGKTTAEYSADHSIFQQGQSADAIFYLRQGKVKLSVISQQAKESRAEPVLPGVSQADLAQMVGTTRSRVSHFLNKFRKLGSIDYSDNDGLTVHSGLLSVVPHD